MNVVILNVWIWLLYLILSLYNRMEVRKLLNNSTLLWVLLENFTAFISILSIIHEIQTLKFLSYQNLRYFLRCKVQKPLNIWSWGLLGDIINYLKFHSESLIHALNSVDWNTHVDSIYFAYFMPEFYDELCQWSSSDTNERFLGINPRRNHLPL